MKPRSPNKSSPCYMSEDKLKIIIRMRPILNEEDSDEFVELEDVPAWGYRTTRFKSSDLATLPS
jgi:hypothetical protein